MCGIAGIVASNAIEYKNKLIKMTDAVRHRGPDGEGHHYFKNCALGHRRLSIVDLKTGQQPMFNRRRSVALIFNGEIYGYKRIRKDLKDYNFQTESDTEVILALYEKYSTSLAKKLPGMFAFALYDSDKNLLYCARDRLGEKPFYYAFGKKGEFIFASEIKAILASSLVSPVVDSRSLSHYLKYLYVHPTRTIYKNVYTLSPGHQLVYVNGKVNISRYWDIPERIEDVSLSDAVDEFRQLFSDSVREQLVADVPVGVLLSGGVDSSSVVSVAAQNSKFIKTFSFGFSSFPNELKYARLISKKYSTDHYEIVEKDFSISEMLLKMQEVYDEPFADSSNIPTFLITRLTRRKCKVVLGGDGGDELLGGYEWYKTFLAKTLIKSNALADIARMVAVASVKYPKLSPLTDQMNYLKIILRNDVVSKIHSLQNEYFSEDEITGLGLKSENLTYSGMGSDVVNNLQKIDVQNYLPGDILVKVDRASMANSLEMRAPFLNAKLTEFLLRLPTCLKVTKSDEKIILKKALGDVLPKIILQRKKQGFGMGSFIGKWMKDEGIKVLSKEILENNNSRIFSLISKEKYQKYLEMGNYKSWILLNLALWADANNFFSIG